jgi:hypothetical protein
VGHEVVNMTATINDLAKSVTTVIDKQPGNVLDKNIIKNLVVEELTKFVPRVTGTQTCTKLALGAIDQLEKANITTVKEAITTITNKGKSGADVMEYMDDNLSRKAFDEILLELAEGWSKKTIETFISSSVFQMKPDKPEVMDSIVSIAILNDPDLERELRTENMPETTEKDLLEARKIVWQYPTAGTPLEPPYIILVAVKDQDSDAADDVVKSILEQLDIYKDFKLPKTTIAKLTRGSLTAVGNFSRQPMKAVALRTTSVR